MNTWQAAIAHVGIAALQAAAAQPFFDNTHPSGALANTGVQIGVQLALVALQAAVAKRNSTTDPNGNKLMQTAPGHYVTEHK